MKDCYYILGIPQNANLNQVKTAYRELSKKFHPDLNPGDKFFEDRFRDIHEAYTVLSVKLKQREFKHNSSSHEEPIKNHHTDDNYESEESQNKSADVSSKRNRTLAFIIFSFVGLGLLMIVKLSTDNSPVENEVVRTSYVYEKDEEVLQAESYNKDFVPILSDYMVKHLLVISGEVPFQFEVYGENATIYMFNEHNGKQQPVMYFERKETTDEEIVWFGFDDVDFDINRKKIIEKRNYLESIATDDERDTMSEFVRGLTDTADFKIQVYENEASLYMFDNYKSKTFCNY